MLNNIRILFIAIAAFSWIVLMFSLASMSASHRLAKVCCGTTAASAVVAMILSVI